MKSSKMSALSKYRLDQAYERLKSARILFEAGSFGDSLSRSYYAMLSAARALLATKTLDSKKHSGVISLFNQHFVKEGLVNKELGRLIAEAKGIREENDYADYVTFSEEDAKDQLSNAEKFVADIKCALTAITPAEQNV